MFVQQYMNSAGVKFNPVPYNGHSERLNAILGGFVDLTELPPSVASSMLRAKKLKALCMLSEEREPDFPDLPTAIEEGVDVEYSSHYALYLPKDTPSEIVIKLVKVCQETLKDPKVVVGLKKVGIPATYIPAEKITEHMDNKLRMYKEIKAQTAKQ